MVLIEDITEQEAEREAAEAAAKLAADKAAAEAAAKAEAATKAAAEAARQASASATTAVPQDAAAQPEASSSDAAGEGGADGAAVSSPAETQPPRELTALEKKQLAQAEALKKEGNEMYSQGRCEDALGKYATALEAAPEAATQQRAVLHCNRAACHIKQEQWAEAAQECSAALELDSKYIKALLRRCTAYEKLDDLERALADAEKVLELEPGNSAAGQVAKRLTPVVVERREKLKDEMMGKLKDLGNMVLGKFGLSVDNFKAEQDPSTGSYSIKFQQ